MAFSTKITFVPRDNGAKSVSFDNVDYGLIPIGGGVKNIEDNISKNFTTLNFRVINSHYFDFVSVITIDEFFEFHKKHHQSNSNESNSINDFIKITSKKVRYNWVVVEVYEWESGLG